MNPHDLINTENQAACVDAYMGTDVFAMMSSPSFAAAFSSSRALSNLLKSTSLSAFSSS